MVPVMCMNCSTVVEASNGRQVSLPLPIRYLCPVFVACDDLQAEVYVYVKFQGNFIDLRCWYKYNCLCKKKKNGIDKTMWIPKCCLLDIIGLEI